MPALPVGWRSRRRVGVVLRRLQGGGAAKATDGNDSVCVAINRTRDHR